MGQKEHIHLKLIESCKNGNERSRFELYQLYSRAMFNVCYRMMNNREEAEDMLQEAFTQAFLKLHTFRHESGFGTWLKRIVINTCINAMNKRKMELAYLEESYQRDIAEDQHNEEVQFDVTNIKKAMSELSEGGRMIFSLYLFEGYDHVEIAQILNISESTSKSQYMRARRRIAEMLKTQSGTNSGIKSN